MSIMSEPNSPTCPSFTSSTSSSSSKASSRSSSPDVADVADVAERLDRDDYTYGTVIDIGGSQLGDTINQDLENRFLLRNGSTQRIFPSAALHGDRGLQMWSEITKLPDYYQTRDEIELLSKNSRELADHLGEALTLIDLGCGDIRKVKPLLDTLEKMKARVRYYALDLSEAVLAECMDKLLPSYRHVKCFGLWGTFDDGLKWVQTVQSPKCYMSLGSMFGNDHFDAAVGRLREWAAIMRPQDRMLLGLDSTQDREVIWKSYHDEEGLFHGFIENGLLWSNELLGHEWYKPGDWTITGEFQEFPLMHHFVIRANRDSQCEALGLSVRKGEKVICYEGFKYEPHMMQKQFAAAGLVNTKLWKSPSGRIFQYMLSIPRP